MEKKEVTDEDRGKVVGAVERNKDMLELGFYGVPAMELAERTLKAKEMMRNALACLMQARFSFQILQVGNGPEKETLIEELMKAENFFMEKYKIVFGEFASVVMEPKKE